MSGCFFLKHGVLTGTVSKITDKIANCYPTNNGHQDTDWLCDAPSVF